MQRPKEPRSHIHPPWLGGGQAPSTHTPATYGPPYLMSGRRSPQGRLAALQGSGQHHPIQRFKAQRLRFVWQLKL